MRFTDIRLKVIRFFRKYKTILLLVLLAWAIIFFINLFLMKVPEKKKVQTTYEPHISVMDQNSKVPTSVSNKAEDMIKEYIDTCNRGEFQIAFNMLSEECRKYEFNDNVDNFMNYVYTKMPTPKKYAIQDYSNISIDGKKLYIYEIKYFDDLLATGLTGQDYNYSTEKIVFQKGDDGKQVMSVGNYIYYTDIKQISENEYLKIDVINRLVNYSAEMYEVKFTNRSDYTVVVADMFSNEEVFIQLPNEVRERIEKDENIVLGPRESTEMKLSFSKFVDDGDAVQGLTFSNIRVVENYSGPDADKNILKTEFDNAIAKFSMTIGL